MSPPPTTPPCRSGSAWLAGIGLRGKNGLLILPPYGTYVFLGTILTGAALDVPERPAAPDCPGCGACRRPVPPGPWEKGGRTCPAVCPS